MSPLNIITAEQRVAEKRGAKILLAGPSGVGKTSQLRTLDLANTLFVDIEGGDLAVQDLAVDTLHIASWDEARDLASLADRYKTLFVDSITAASRFSFHHAERQPECVSRTGAKDLRAAYGLHARQMIDWLNRLQRVRSQNVIFTAILETVKDDLGHSEFQIQIEGAKTGRELPGIVDEIITMQGIDFGDGKPTRAFVCTSPNAWSYPAKDRSGRLVQIEEPNLGKLITKLMEQVHVTV